MEASQTGLLAAVQLSSDYRRRFRLTSAGTFALKGVRDPVAAVRVEGHAGDVLPPELFGRREATDRLEQIIRQARDGIGGLALVVGDAGMGKSALVTVCPVTLPRMASDV